MVTVLKTFFSRDELYANTQPLKCAVCINCRCTIHKWILNSCFLVLSNFLSCMHFLFPPPPQLCVCISWIFWSWIGRFVYLWKYWSGCLGHFFNFLSFYVSEFKVIYVVLECGSDFGFIGWFICFPISFLSLRACKETKEDLCAWKFCAHTLF